jgi:hypothetical protein
VRVTWLFEEAVELNNEIGSRQPMTVRPFVTGQPTGHPIRTFYFLIFNS